MTDLVDKARTAVTERAELPGMSLLEHLEELRKRIIHSGIYLIIGFFVAYGFHERIYAFMQQPIVGALTKHHLDFLIGYAGQFKPMVTVGEYTDLFMTVILGLGITFELPILVFFLALFGIVSAGFLWKNVRYAILIIFIIAAIITPTPEVLTMCVFAAPMLVLYLISIGVAYMVHPTRRNRKKLAA
jgi:Sec-independent protein secretion pathway component TatC